MRFCTVSAHAFGALRDQHLTFAPGLNVVFGLNESGKSTWHAALYLGLCGLRRGKGRKSGLELALERYRPWSGPAWQVGAVIQLADGRQIELRHDLDSRTALTVAECATGRPRGGEITHDGAPDGARWLGLDRQAFLKTACVRQGDLLAVHDDPKALQVYLQRAAASTTSNTTAAAALERIQQFRDEQVGTDRAPTKPLRQASDGLLAAQRALEQAQQAAAEYRALAAQCEALEQARRDAEHRRRVLGAAGAARTARRGAERLARARELAARVPNGAPAPLTDDDRLARAVAAALAAWQDRPPVEALAGASVAELEAELASLPPEPEGDRTPHAAVVAARERLLECERLSQLHQQAAPARLERPATGSASEGQLRSLASDLETPVPAIDPAVQRGYEAMAAAVPPAGGRRGLLLGAVVALALATLGAFALGQPIVGAVLIVATLAAAWGAFGAHQVAAAATPDRAAEAAYHRAQAAVEIATQRVAEARQQAQRLGLPAEPGALRTIANRLVSFERAEAEQVRWEAQLAALTAQAATAAAALAAALDERGSAPGPDLLARLESYEQACRQRSQQAAAAARRAPLEQQIADRRLAERSTQAACQRVVAAQQGLADALRQCGLGPAPSGDAAATALAAWQTQRDARVGAHQQSIEAWERLQALLDGATIEDLAGAAQERHAAATASAAGLPPAEVEAALQLDDLDAAGLEADAALREALQAAAAARAHLDAVSARLPNVALAEERVAAAEAELARVRRLAGTLDKTTEYLVKAQARAHHDIAPVLAESVRRWLPAVTQGRYQEVQVDPETLDVRVRGAGGLPREATSLSHGTAEQVYLLLRIALAERLVTNGEVCPLILDDVTVQSDEHRSLAILTALHALSAERQIILFSQERDVLEWAEAHLQASKRDALSRLGPALVPA